jgi:hypothetical protein
VQQRRPAPYPSYAPPDRAGLLARWLAEDATPAALLVDLSTCCVPCWQPAVVAGLGPTYHLLVHCSFVWNAGRRRPAGHCAGCVLYGEQRGPAALAECWLKYRVLSFSAAVVVPDSWPARRRQPAPWTHSIIHSRSANHVPGSRIPRPVASVRILDRVHGFSGQLAHAWSFCTIPCIFIF